MNEVNNTLVKLPPMPKPEEVEGCHGVEYVYFSEHMQAYAHAAVEAAATAPLLEQIAVLQEQNSQLKQQLTQSL